jgi:hypothetical protein
MRTSLLSAATSLALASSLAMLSGCASAQAAAPVATETTSSTEVVGHGADKSGAKAGSKWESLHKGEASDVKVHWPDGHTSVGLDKHYGELDSLFAFAPDTHVEAEQSRTVSGDWTTVIRTVAGTATTSGKPFKIWVATISHQNNGVIDEEYLFWNDKTLKAQIGS